MAIILGIVVGEIYLEGFNGVTPQRGGTCYDNVSEDTASVVLD